MIANPIGYPTPNPMCHPNRGRIPRPVPSHTNPILRLAVVFQGGQYQIQSHRYLPGFGFGDWA